MTTDRGEFKGLKKQQPERRGKNQKRGVREVRSVSGRKKWVNRARGSQKIKGEQA